MNEQRWKKTRKKKKKQGETAVLDSSALQGTRPGQEGRGLGVGARLLPG